LRARVAKFDGCASYATSRWLGLRPQRASNSRARVRRSAVIETRRDENDHEDARSIGGDLGDSRDELLAVIRDIYPPEKERLGVLAIEVELIT
jgi:hypothetical protein